MLEHVLFTEKVKNEDLENERDLLIQLGNMKACPSWQTLPFKIKTRNWHHNPLSWLLWNVCQRRMQMPEVDSVPGTFSIFKKQVCTHNSS